MKFRVTYTKEFSKIIYASNRNEAEFKFNRNPDNDEKTLEYIEEETE